MKLAVVIPFLNEAEHLPTLLDSLRRQEHRPHEVVLVDDGSTDGSGEMADAFAAEFPGAHVERRPKRPASRDRLITAAEWRAFLWGVEQLREEPDVVVKLDGDLSLPPGHFAAVVERFARDPRLGMTGAYLSRLLPDGTLEREGHPPEHVRGPNKFYRWACWQQIQPVAAVPGWEGVDEAKARMHGWTTSSFELEGGDPVHLRPTGLHDGRLRAFRRWGLCAWHYGAHPVYVLLGGVFRFRQRPYVLGGLSYVFGWVAAGLRGVPRAEPEVVRFVQRENLRDIPRRARRMLPLRTSG